MDEYVPGKHGRGDADRGGQNLPLPQRSAKHDPIRMGWEWGGFRCGSTWAWRVLQAVAAVSLWYVPAGQLSHNFAPMAAAKVPALHAFGSTLPVVQ